MRPKTRIAVLLCGTAALNAACGDGAGPATDFLLNWLKWKDTAPASYVYDFQRSCYCTTESLEAVRITVQDGQVVAVVRQSDGQPVPQPDRDQLFRITIDSLFGIIAAAMDRHASDIHVRYDPQRRYPADVQIDYLANAIDEELGFTARLIGPPATP